MTTACLSRNWIVEVSMPEEKKKTQSAVSSNKEHVKYEATQNLFVSYVPTHDRLDLTGKRPQQRSQGPQQQLKARHPTVYLRGAQRNNRRRDLYNTTLKVPGTHPLAMLLCGFSWRAVIVITTTSSSFSHACACHVYIHVCMYAYLPKFSKQLHYYDPYRSAMGNVFTVILLV